MTLAVSIESCFTRFAVGKHSCRRVTKEESDLIQWIFCFFTTEMRVSSDVSSRFAVFPLFLLSAFVSFLWDNSLLMRARAPLSSFHAVCSLLQNVMALLLYIGLWLLASAACGAVKNCYPGCHCEVETFGLFDSFSLTRVDCGGLGPGATMPIPIPLDTTHLDLSSNAMGPLNDTVLAGPGYTTLVNLDLSSNHITEVSGWGKL